ncbi:Hypothetical protein CINCED_3A025000, partial [Cinara cedri]
MFNNELFCLHQINRVFKSYCKGTESDEDLINRNSFISSANRSLREFKKFKSLINRINNKGARYEPCGTPDRTSNGFE